jgi:hypothetical protein
MSASASAVSRVLRRAGLRLVVTQAMGRVRINVAGEDAEEARRVLLAAGYAVSDSDHPNRAWLYATRP